MKNKNLFKAILKNNYKSVVKSFQPSFFNLIKGADVNAKNKDGDTPIIQEQVLVVLMR